MFSSLSREATRNIFLVAGGVSFFIILGTSFFGDSYGGKQGAIIRIAVLGMIGAFLSLVASMHRPQDFFKWGFYYAMPFLVFSVFTLQSIGTKENSFIYMFYTWASMYSICFAGGFAGRVFSKSKKSP